MSASFIESSTAPLTSCEYTTDGGSSWLGANLSLSSGSSNCYTQGGVSCSDGQPLSLNMRATNALGEQGLALGASRTCDALPPSTGHNAPASWQAGDVTVFLSPMDSVSGVAYTFHCQSPVNACSPLSSGTVVSVGCAAESLCQTYVRFNSGDMVSNTEPVQSALVRIDKQAPSTTDNASSAWQGSDANVALSASDGSGSGVASTLSCQDSGNSCAPSSPGTSALVNCPIGSACSTYLRYASQDMLGNIETAKSRLVRIDKQAPATADNAPASWQGGDVTVALSATDGLGAGVASTLSCQDSSDSCVPSVPGAAPVVSCPAGSLCQTYLRYASQDAVGNLEAVKSRLVRIDKQAPTTSDNAPASWQAADIAVSLSASDGSGSGVASTLSCQDSGNSCAPSAPGSSALVSCPAGSTCSTYLRYASQDAAGNAETAKSRLVLIDKQAPSGGSVSYPNGNTVSPISVSFANGSDGSGSGLGNRTLQRQEATLSHGQCGSFGAFATIAVNPAASPLADSVARRKCYRYQYIVQDAVGNQATYASPNTAKVK